MAARCTPRQKQRAPPHVRLPSRLSASHALYKPGHVLARPKSVLFQRSVFLVCGGDANSKRGAFQEREAVGHDDFRSLIVIPMSPSGPSYMPPEAIEVRAADATLQLIGYRVVGCQKSLPAWATQVSLITFTHCAKLKQLNRTYVKPDRYILVNFYNFFSSCHRLSLWSQGSDHRWL